ncbi:amidase [Halorubrum sp. 48-1-W]|uniref:amidase n=1 Tax=Halorubrum sp. 48-1-W TaxID=2249761 RepID=UPI000DCCF63F|nr:amidase [Halorubrum sp. 48-1-W]RAW43912.1 amidase [Halorubrum sp. 48-1-W]
MDSNTTEIGYTSATTLASQIRNGDLSPVTVIQTFLDRIERINPTLNAYVTVCDEKARAAAQKAERAVKRGDDLGPLHGVPVAIKDLTHVRDVRTTLGSPAFTDHISETDDTVVSRLRDSGAIILGKTNTPEFGRKTVTDNPVFGASGNPWDPERTTGGSSGGSAAAVAAGLAPIALGSDAAGSIRIPSSACGVVGIVPDFGRVPFGPNHTDAFQNDLPYTFLGPITRTIEDATVMLDVMAGPDDSDPYSLPTPPEMYRDTLGGSLSNVRIGYTSDFGDFPVDDAVLDVIESTLEGLSKAGATVVDIDVDFEGTWEKRHDVLEWILQERYVGLYEALRRDPGVDLLETDLPITPEVRSRIRAGLELDSTKIAKSRQHRTAIYNTIQSALSDIDVLAMPTLGRTAFERSVEAPMVDGETVHPMHGWTLTWPLNLSGNPSASLPVGFDEAKLPVGLQIVGDRLADQQVVRVSAAIEQEVEWDGSYPPEAIESLT